MWEDLTSGYHHPLDGIPGCISEESQVPESTTLCFLIKDVMLTTASSSYCVLGFSAMMEYSLNYELQ